MGKLKLFRLIDRKRFGINVLVVLILLKIFFIYISIINLYMKIKILKHMPSTLPNSVLAITHISENSL